MLTADLILVNGKIWTGDPQNRFAEAVAIKENAMEPVWAVIPPPTLEQRRGAARAALNEAARAGLTARCDMSGGDAAFEDFRAYQQLLRDGALTARIYLFVPLGSYKRLAAARIETADLTIFNGKVIFERK